MDDATPSTSEVGPLLLEELVEPIDDRPVLAPLSAGTILTGPDAATFTVAAFIRSTGEYNTYAASASDGCPVQLYESAGDALPREVGIQAEILAGFDCPQFPRLIARFSADDRSYLVVSSGPECNTLADMLQNPTVDQRELLRILAQVAYGAARLHERGWAHLGLRPSAIRLGRPIQIGGLTHAARIGEPLPERFSYAGYSAPELPICSSADPRADVYGVGAILFHGITGAPIPETGADLAVWKPGPGAAGIPQILFRCLGPQDTRYSAMDELQKDLVRLIRRTAPQVTHTAVGDTTIGLEPSRRTNQDAYGWVTGRRRDDGGSCTWTVACVADGMGGMEAGEVASSAAVRSVLSLANGAFATCPEPSPEEQIRWVKEWAAAANTAVCDELSTRRANGGTTLTCVCLVEDRLTMAHIGDSRLYLVRDGDVRVLSRDHSLAMALVMQGEIGEADVRTHPDRSKVTRSLGDRDPLPAYYIEGLDTLGDGPMMAIHHGDTLLLCSDGLWEPVLEADIARTLLEQPEPGTAAGQLLTLALQEGGSDNATVLMLRMNKR